VGKLQTSDDGSAMEQEEFLSLYLPHREVPECIFKGDMSQNTLQQGKMYLKSTGSQNRV